MRPKREYNTERLQVRLAPSAKELIQRAIWVTGFNAGELAYEGARRVLEEHERMVLTGADRDTFLDAILDPPPPSALLVAALRRHRNIFG